MQKPLSYGTTIEHFITKKSKPTTKKWKKIKNRINEKEKIRKKFPKKKLSNQPDKKIIIDHTVYTNFNKKFFFSRSGIFNKKKTQKFFF